MTKIFKYEDIKQWAFFSGDYNAVHFDELVAKKNGLKDIIVQGMLYLLYSKLSLTDELEYPARITYRLKKPIYKNAAVGYSSLKESAAIILKIQGLDSDSSVLGRAYHDPGEPVIQRASNEIIIDPDFITDQLRIFKATYPEINVPWIIMDAFLFSVCFKYQNGDPFYRKALKITKEPDKSKVVTYQVDQDIFINQYDFPSEPDELKELRFFYEDQDVIKEDYSVYSVLNYQVYHKDLLLYQSSMGSVTRAFEAQSNASVKGISNAL